MQGRQISQSKTLKVINNYDILRKHEKKNFIKLVWKTFFLEFWCRNCKFYSLTDLNIKCVQGHIEHNIVYYTEYKKMFNLLI